MNRPMKPRYELLGTETMIRLAHHHAELALSDARFRALNYLNNGSRQPATDTAARELLRAADELEHQLKEIRGNDA